MNTQPTSPDLTAYALGELDHENDAAVRALLGEDDAAQAELDAITDFAQLLHASAPVPTAKLHAPQRQAILNGPERVREMVSAASKTKIHPRRSPSVLSQVLRYAAVVTLTSGAFYLGKRSGDRATLVVAEPKSTQPSVPAVATAVVKTPSLPAAAPDFARPVIKLQTPAPAADLPAPTPVAPVVVKVAAPAPPQLAVASLPPQTKEPIVIGPRTSLKLAAGGTSQSTTTSAAALLSIRPSVTRPVRAVDKSALAAPIHPQTVPASQPKANEKSPALLIHSWRAEAAPCPWDSRVRLVRLSAQIPGEQPAALTDSDYDLRVLFQPGHVRSFRPIAQRCVAPSNPEGAAVHSTWYEIVPNGLPTTSPRNLGHVALRNTAFTTAAMSIFDTNKIQIVDQGATLAEASDDFLFESAVIGFGLLMEGKAPSAQLNHRLILTLAQRAQRAGDRTGERAKFIKTVKEAVAASGVAME
jgi:hypothetical protein